MMKYGINQAFAANVANGKPEKLRVKNQCNQTNVESSLDSCEFNPATPEGKLVDGWNKLSFENSKSEKKDLLGNNC